MSKPVLFLCNLSGSCHHSIHIGGSAFVCSHSHHHERNRNCLSVCDHDPKAECVEVIDGDPKNEFSSGGVPKRGFLNGLLSSSVRGAM